MSKSKKQPFKPPYSASCIQGNKFDTFGMICESMCKTKVFQDLTPSAKVMYVLCRVQSASEDGRRCLFQHAKQYEREYSADCFVFPAQHMEKYGLDRRNAKKQIDLLVSAGFLDIVEENRQQKLVNVYRFSSRWKEPN